MAQLARIQIYPFKSLDGQSVAEAVLLPNGALQHDRRFALRDREGNFVNGKRTPAAHRLRTHLDPASGMLRLRIEGTETDHRFDVVGQRGELAAWLSDFFQVPLEVVEHTAGGFPDDTEAPGPTVVSTATLAEVGKWFDGLTLESVRGRFRANLEISGDEPFWEDQLIAGPGEMVRFRIGEAELWGMNPCQRCIVPTRDPRSGEPLREFAKTFARQRETSLPAWAPGARFDHFYRLSVNTRRAGDAPCTIRVGDPIEILGVVPVPPGT